jgi:hypothetical protein
VRKRIFILFLFLILIEILSISNLVVGFECRLDYIEVDKENYYPDETIKINASWGLDYNPVNVEAYIQVRITDEFDVAIWNSSKYDGIGNYTENWSIDINLLNLIINNYTYSLYIKFLSIYHQIGTMDIISNILEITQITIIKRIPYCKLIDFKDRINYGENLSFQARFYDSFIENNTFLNNQLIIFQISSNSSIIFQSNFTTDDFGIINISVSSVDDLGLGIKKLVFVLGENNVFNDSIFQYTVFVERNPVFIDIINFKEILESREDLRIELFYYYFLNNTSHPLENQSIELAILSDHNITYTQIFSTDEGGILSVNIPHNLLSSNKENKEITLSLKYNGSLYLGNKTLSLNLNIKIYEQESGFQLILISSVTTSAIIVLISLVILFRFKKPKKIILPEITIRY